MWGVQAGQQCEWTLHVWNTRATRTYAVHHVQCIHTLHTYIPWCSKLPVSWWNLSCNDFIQDNSKRIHITCLGNTTVEKHFRRSPCDIHATGVLMSMQVWACAMVWRHGREAMYGPPCHTPNIMCHHHVSTSTSCISNTQRT